MEDADDFGGPAYQQAVQLCEQGRFEEAMPLLAASARVSPHFKTYERLGECLLRLGRAAEAVLPLAAACALNVGPRARVLLARALAQLGEAHEARSWIADALQRHPGYGPAVDALRELGV